MKNIIQNLISVRFRPNEIVLSFNGGKDSTVILHVVKSYLEKKGRPQALQEMKFVHLEGDNEFAEILSFRA